MAGADSLVPSQSLTFPTMDLGDGSYQLVQSATVLPGIVTVALEVDGVMVGRAAIERTLALSEMRCALFEGAAPVTAEALVLRWLPYVREQLAAGVPLSRFTRLLSGVLHGRPGARRARRRLAEGARSADAALIERALADLGPEAAAA